MESLSLRLPNRLRKDLIGVGGTKVKIKDFPLDSAIETLVATGLFRKFNLNNPSDLPQHLIFCGTKFYFYLDHDLPLHLKRAYNPHLDELSEVGEQSGP